METYKHESPFSFKEFKDAIEKVGSNLINENGQISVDGKDTSIEEIYDKSIEYLEGNNNG